MLWTQSFLFVLLFILIPMVNQSGLFRPWKIRFVLVSFLGRAVGRTIYLCLSLLITTATMLLS
jgi:hypothetical protein